MAFDEEVVVFGVVFIFVEEVLVFVVCFVVSGEELVMIFRVDFVVSSFGA